MVAIFIKAAASLATGVLAFSSARNIAETISIMSSQEDQTAEVVDKSPLLQKYISSDKKIGSSISLLVPNDKTSDDIVQDLKQMKRKELLTLFLLCEAPTATAEKDVLLGSWDGTLLNNNSVLTSVSGFISNELFGRKYGNWCGKAFGIDNGGKMIGINRFRSKTNSAKVDQEHKFDVKLSQSKLRGEGCLLDYSLYQEKYSPWKTMVDEVRVLRCNPHDDGRDDCSILLGMGSLGWSGAFLNSQPFCLARCSSEFQ